MSAIDGELLGKQAHHWRLYVPANDGTIGSPVEYHPRNAQDLQPWVATSTGRRVSSDDVISEPPPDTNNMVCRTCRQPLGHAHGTWLHFDGECGDCTALYLANELRNC